MAKWGDNRKRSSTERRRSYRAYLRSDAWAAKRAEVYASRRHRCSICLAEGVPLDVHHLTYRNQGREKMEDLTLLCRYCHTEVHKVAKSRGIDIGTSALREVTNHVRQQHYRKKKRSPAERPRNSG